MATLSAGNKTKPLMFELSPEQVVASVKGDYAQNAVLNTYAPVVTPKSSARSIRVGRVLLISKSLLKNQQAFVDTIQYWARSGTRLKFNHHRQGLNACYISNLNIEIKQTRGGNPVHVEIDFELIEAAVPPPPKVPAKPALGKRATPNQQQKKTKTIQKKLKTPTKKVALGIAGDFNVLVSSLSQVSIESDGVTKEYDYDDLIAQIG